MSEQFLYFLQQMFNGVTLGSTYALIAIGYTMVYGIIGMINFAHCPSSSSISCSRCLTASRWEAPTR